jgi:hypothetical protein
MFSYPVMENILLHPLKYIFQNTCFFNGKQISVFYGKQKLLVFSVIFFKPGWALVFGKSLDLENTYLCFHTQ